MMRTQVDLQAPTCLAEPTLLMNALDNLYSNAVHYGTESGNIYLHSRREGTKVIIDIINTRTPIPDAEKLLIFAPFYQGSHQRKGAVKGSGLGLSLARDSVRKMHGELYLSDAQDGNVCFRIELPTPGLEKTTT